MNTLVHLDSYSPRPSMRLPYCNRLPPRVHLQLCRELEGTDQLWENLAKGFPLSEGRKVASLGSDTVSKFRSLRSPRTATALLEHWWKEEALTIGDLLDAFCKLDICGSIIELLDDFVEDKLAGGDADRLEDDPRDQVG